MAFYEQMVAALGAIKREDAFPYEAKADVVSMRKALNGLAAMTSTAGLCVELLAGQGVAGTSTLQVPASAVVGGIAFMTATGAVAAKALLLPTTDLTVSGSTLTWVTNQAANTCFVLYEPAKTW